MNGPNPFTPNPYGQQNPYAPPANPYAPPQAMGGAYAPAAAGPFVAWMEGANLVVQKEAPLPDACMKCGASSIVERRNQRFVFTPPWVIVIFLVSPIIGAVVALIVQKKGRLHLPLCAEHARRWKQGILFMWLGVGWLIVAMILGAIALGNELPEAGVPLFISSFVGIIVAAVMNKDRFLRAKKIDEQTISLSGVDPNAAQAILAVAQGR